MFKSQIYQALFFVGFLAIAPTPVMANEQSCKKLIGILGASPTKPLAPIPLEARAAPETFDSLMRAFEHGLVPNLNDRNQMMLFAVYRLQRLGDPSIVLTSETWERMAKVQRDFPQLGKVPFSPVEVVSLANPLQETKVTVRPLSFTEAPLRGCLGKDCSTESYLEKAFENRYHYFTVTDSTGHSDGHVTVVLGSANTDSGEIAVAFVDKIQNIPNEDLAKTLEAVRLSVGKEGYTLALPRDLGDNNGLTNLSHTSEFIEKELSTYREQKVVYKSFQPKEAEVKFENGHSRAADKLDSIPVLPYENLSFRFDLKKAEPPWKIDELDAKKILANIYTIRKENPQEKLVDQKRLVTTLFHLIEAGQPLDAQLDKLANLWLRTSQPLSLKNLILTKYLEKNDFSKVAELSAFLTPAQRAHLVQNWLQTPIFATLIAQNPTHFIAMSAYHLPTLVPLYQAALARNPRVAAEILNKLHWGIDSFDAKGIERALASAPKDTLESLTKKLNPTALNASEAKRRKNLVESLLSLGEPRGAFSLNQANLLPVAGNINILKTILQFADAETANILAKKLPMVEASLAKTVGWPNLHSRLQPIYELLDRRKFLFPIEVDPKKVANVSPFELLPLPNGNQVRLFAKEINNDRVEVQWINSEGVVYVTAEGRRYLRGSRISVAPNGDVALMANGELQIYREGKEIGKPILVPSSSGFPAALPNGDYLLGDVNGFLYKIQNRVLTKVENFPPPNVETAFFYFRPTTLSDGTTVVANSTGIISQFANNDIYWIKDGKISHVFQNRGKSISTPYRLPNDTVVVADSGGRILWLKNGEVLHEWNFKGEIFNVQESPAIVALSDGTIVVPMQNRVFWLKDGKLIDSVAGNFSGAQKLESGSVALIPKNGSPAKIYAFQVDPQLAGRNLEWRKLVNEKISTQARSLPWVQEVLASAIDLRMSRKLTFEEIIAESIAEWMRKKHINLVSQDSAQFSKQVLECIQR